MDFQKYNMGFEKMYGGNVPQEGRHQNDYYPTPPVATYALCRYDDVPKNIWEPAAGRGWISQQLERQGKNVYSSDLYAYPDPLIKNIVTGTDFLATDQMPEGYLAIITNPPYRNNMAQKFIEHSIELGAQYIAMLCRLTFMESQTRLPLWQKHPPQRVFVFSDRVNVDEEYFDNKQLGGMIAFAWYVWDYRQYTAPNTILHWMNIKQMYQDWRNEF